MRKVKYNKTFIVFVCILSVYLLTCVISSNLFARYKSGNDLNKKTNVAEFNIPITFNDHKTLTKFDLSYEYKLVPGSKEAIDIKLDATKNEVTVNCTIIFEIISLIPLEIIYDDLDVSTVGIVTEINPGEIKELENIIISWNESDNSYKYNGSSAIINVKILVEQVE